MRSSRPLSLAVALAALALTACGGVNAASAGVSGATGGAQLSLVAYSTPKEAYEKLIPAFAKTRAGAGASFTQSYGASGQQSRAVESGLPADLVALSLAPDVDRLVKAGLVPADWAKGPFHGSVTHSVVVLAVRKGNPKQIEGWDDLVEPGVEVITPNPFTSGGAKWNLMAAYGAQLKRGKSPAQALSYLKALLAHTPVQDKSAREALQTFNGGKGDVLIAYENEAITAQQNDLDLDYVIPDETIRVENPIAVTTQSKHPAEAKAFIDYARSPAGQRSYAAAGYRSVRPELVDRARFPTPAKQFDIAQLGGWARVDDAFFDPERGSVAKLERELGVSTAK